MKAKVIILLIIIVLFTIFVTQNTEVITVKAFFWQFPMSLIVLMVILGFVGVIMGFVIAKFSEKPSKKKGNMQTQKETLPDKIEKPGVGKL